MQVSYEEFIEKLNRREARRVDFAVEGYSHYRHCVIEWREDVLSSGVTLYFLEVRLTEDGAERVSFYKSFDETYKLFRMGRKGSFTLKQLWNRIRVIQTEYVTP